MMKKLFLIAAAATVATPSFGQASDVITVSVRGAGSWEMICHVLTASGDQVAEVVDGHRSTLSSRDFHSVSCEQTASARGPLVVSISGPATCPFKGATAGTCSRTFASGSVGSFTTRRKR
jgi:hypothetical protein